MNIYLKLFRFFQKYKKNVTLKRVVYIKLDMYIKIEKNYDLKVMICPLLRIYNSKTNLRYENDY